MPGFLVFPGGALDPGDGLIAAGHQLDDETMALLSVHCSHRRSKALAWTAIRETWEETGLLIGRPAEDGKDAVPQASDAVTQAFVDAGLTPDLRGLTYVARAITPTFSPIRFDTRFFAASGDTAFGAARDSSELSDIKWWSTGEVFREAAIAMVTKFALNQAVRRWSSPRHVQTHAVPTMLHRRRRIILRDVGA